MSAYLMGRVFYTELPAHLKLTLLALADHAHDDGSNVRVGQARLARKVGTSSRSVRAHVKELRELGFIEKLGREGSHGQDRHRIVVEKLPTDDQITLFDRPPANPRPEDVADRQPTAARQPVVASTGSPASLDRKPASAEPSENRQGTKPLAAPRPRDEGWEVFVQETGVDDHELSEDRRAALNGMLATIRRLTPGLTAGGIRARAREWRRRFPNAPLTPETLVRRWAELGGRKGSAAAAAPTPEDGHEFIAGAVTELCAACGEAEYRHVRSLADEREGRDAAAELAAHVRVAVEDTAGDHQDAEVSA